MGRTMVDCKSCENTYCPYAKMDRGFVVSCSGYKVAQKPKTNADRIRAMSDEELAKWMSGGALHSDSVCSYCDRNTLEFCDGAECSNKTDAEIILDWLKQPVKDGEGE